MEHRQCFGQFAQSLDPVAAANAAEGLRRIDRIPAPVVQSSAARAGFSADRSVLAEQVEHQWVGMDTSETRIAKKKAAGLRSYQPVNHY